MALKKQLGYQHIPGLASCRTVLTWTFKFPLQNAVLERVGLGAPENQKNNICILISPTPLHPQLIFYLIDRKAEEIRVPPFNVAVLFILDHYGCVKKWSMPIRNWRAALNHFMIVFDERLSDYQ